MQIIPDADLDLAIQECIAGSLSFNGQRCTALKIVYVHERIARIQQTICKKMDALVFEIHGMKRYITPLREEKPAYIQELIDDAIQKVLQ
jgi:glyceraldehyde-3-phosphate dehydrogenase (NADP+)